ncbi:hypothetical protein [Paraburkholderia bannensis]|uniref:hypothetical protein n=1 Tax=Paraburkholderia TaxID=1822464 RepID=UPI003906BB16
MGFISSMSKPFCPECPDRSRARVFADFKMFSCRFARRCYELSARPGTLAG